MSSVSSSNSCFVFWSTYGKKQRSPLFLLFRFVSFQSRTFPCSQAKEFCCGQACQQILKCENHLCHRPCHSVTKSGIECVQCEEMCSKQRPTGCQHSCPLACHPGDCPPCKQRLRMRCHCNSQVIYIDCYKFTGATDEEKERLKSCGKSCAKKVFVDVSLILNFVFHVSSASLRPFMHLFVPFSIVFAIESMFRRSWCSMFLSTHSTNNALSSNQHNKTFSFALR